MTAAEAWQQALADVLAGRPPTTIAPIVRVEPETVRRWLRGVRVPCGWMWRALVIEAGMEGRWAELSAARDAVARKPTGRPPLSEAEYAERQLGRRKRKISQGADAPKEA